MNANTDRKRNHADLDSGDKNGIHLGSSPAAAGGKNDKITASTAAATSRTNETGATGSTEKQNQQETPFISNSLPEYNAEVQKYFRDVTAQ